MAVTDYNLFHTACWLSSDKFPLKINNKNIQYSYLILSCFNSEVYKCIYEGITRAVKQVPTNWTTKEEVDHEVELLNKLKGQLRIVNLIHIFKSETKWNFVFELMPNGHLYEFLERKFSNGGRYTEDELLSTFMDIFCGVKAIHDQNIIHRDLKPENILVDEKNRLKISDFGLSIMLERDEFIPYAKDIQILEGIFIADEIVSRKMYDKRCDMWSIGIILFKMATREATKETVSFDFQIFLSSTFQTCFSFTEI